MRDHAVFARPLWLFPQPIARESAKRAHTFQAVANGVEIDNPISPKPLCPTRWTVRFVAIDAAFQSYPIRPFMPFLSEVATMATVDDSASKARGLSSQCEDGQTMLALIAAHCVFRVTEGLLSRSLQSSTATICGCMEYGICTTRSYSTASAKHKIRRVILESMA